MEFQNAGIDIDSLPRASDAGLKPIDPRYLKVLWRQWLAGWLLVMLAAAAIIIFTSNLHDSIWILLVTTFLMVIAVINWTLIVRSFRNKAWAVREHDIIYRTGWLVLSTRICPFNRIQHCSVDAGIFERKFGLASVSVFTAGGNEADMKIPGLPSETADALRELIIKKTGTDGSNT